MSDGEIQMPGGAERPPADAACPHCRRSPLQLALTTLLMGDGRVLAVYSCTGCGAVLPAQIVLHHTAAPKIMLPGDLRGRRN